jgi:hypothetical protein
MTAVWSTFTVGLEPADPMDQSSAEEEGDDPLHGRRANVERCARFPAETHASPDPRQRHEAEVCERALVVHEKAERSISNLVTVWSTDSDPFVNALSHTHLPSDPGPSHR